MANTETLFGYLAERFYQHPENLATESLNFFLNRSNHAINSLVDLLNQTNIKISSDIIFSTQVKENENVFDVVGKNSDGENVIIIESKFWAGLTDNQPASYLDKLAKNKESILLFVAPSLRFQTLWPEMVRRCKVDGFCIQEIKKVGRELIFTNFDSNHILALTSWRLLLSKLIRELESASQNILVNDVLQLKGLCDKLDREAFLPIQSHELSSNIGTRIYEFCGIVNIVVEKLKSKKICHTKGLRASAGFGYYGRYFIMKKWGCFFHFSAECWSDERETPLWLSIKLAAKKQWRYSTEVKNLLRELEFEIPPRLIDYENDAIYIPIYLAIGKEQEEVIDDIVVQITKIYQLLNISKNTS